MTVSRLFVLFFMFFFFSFNEGGVAQQKSPFGISAPQAPAPVADNFLRTNLGWVYKQQAAFYKQLTGIVKQAKQDGSAVWTLIGLSFLYGIFHAAGPGHGKIVISSYVLANEQSARRGMLISFMAAFLQGLVAVLLISFATFVFNLTSFALTEATHWFERASYALIVGLGLYLLWQKGMQPLLAHRAIIARATQDHEPGCHYHDHACGCAGHAADPTKLNEPLTGRSAWAAIVSVGLRPCSGALIVLVFAASQGLFITGIISTFAMALGTAITVTTLASVAIGAKGLATRYLSTSGSMGWFFRSVEFLGASLVFLLGITLLGASFYG